MRGASLRIALLGLAGPALGHRGPDAHHSFDRVGREVVDLPKLGNAATDAAGGEVPGQLDGLLR